MKSWSGEIWGGLYILFAMFIIGPNDTLVVVLEDDVGVGQFHFLRSLFAVPLILFIGWVMGTNWTIYRPWAMIIRNLCFTTAMLIYFSSLSFLPMAVTGAGLFTCPIFVLIFSRLFFGQHIGWRRISAVVIGSIGVLIILDPNGTTFSWMNIMPICGGAFLALSNIMTKRYCYKESPILLSGMGFLFLGICGAIASLLLTIYPVQPDGQITAFITTGWGVLTWSVLGLIIVQAMFSTVAMWFMTRAYQIGDPTYINVYEYSFLIFAGLAAWIFLEQHLWMRDIYGIILIVVAGIIATQAGARTDNITLDKPA
ncbi:MAG: DMT family transporter [Alphaproteobacteria bacterium]|nr:DMT family transporter [Alphaproteobacteria bacterium]MBL6781432.1 DMT family transporter [Alphaproteobacteria bacterium]